MVLTKDEIVEAIHNELDYPTPEFKEIVETLIETIGEDMMLDKRRVVTFRCYRVLRQKINDK